MEAIQTPWYEIIINYHHYKGGTYNLQTATVKTMQGAVLKTFSSTKNRAKEYANRFISQENRKLISKNRKHY